MSHLTRSFQQVLASRTNAYLVALVTMVVSSVPMFNQSKEPTQNDLPPPSQAAPKIHEEITEYVLSVPLVQLLLAPESLDSGVKPEAPTKPL